MPDDVYTSESIESEHSMRYVHIQAKNVVGILNRISSLMRRKRYNMEEISVGFDSHNIAQMVIAIDGRLHDVQQIIRQLLKIHDVIDAYDATHLKDKLYYAVYVQAKTKQVNEEMKSMPIKPVQLVCGNDLQECRAIFMLTLKQYPTLIEHLNKHGYSYLRRLMSLI